MIEINLSLPSMGREMCLWEILSSDSQAHFVRQANRPPGLQRNGILPCFNCLPEDEFASGQLVYALTLEEKGDGTVVLTRTDSDLPYYIIVDEYPEVLSGEIQIAGYACIPGEVASLVLAPGRPGVNAMGLFIGRGGSRIGRLGEVCGVGFRLVEYVDDPHTLLRSLVPGYKKHIEKTGGRLVIDEERKAVTAILGGKQLARLTGQYPYLDMLYQQMTGWSLRFQVLEDIDAGGES